LRARFLANSAAKPYAGHKRQKDLLNTSQDVRKRYEK
jgi:hypothetical protein